MMDGLTIMLGVFINLLYTYTLPYNHYSTTYMLLYGQTLPESRQEIKIFFPDLRHETRQHVAVKV